EVEGPGGPPAVLGHVEGPELLERPQSLHVRLLVLECGELRSARSFAHARLREWIPLRAVREMLRFTRRTLPRHHLRFRAEAPPCRGRRVRAGSARSPRPAGRAPRRAAARSACRPPGPAPRSRLR